jgi:hypothetical protein
VNKEKLPTVTCTHLVSSDTGAHIQANISSSFSTRKPDMSVMFDPNNTSTFRVNYIFRTLDV